MRVPDEVPSKKEPSAMTKLEQVAFDQRVYDAAYNGLMEWLDQQDLCGDMLGVDGETFTEKEVRAMCGFISDRVVERLSDLLKENRR